MLSHTLAVWISGPLSAWRSTCAPRQQRAAARTAALARRVEMAVRFKPPITVATSLGLLALGLGLASCDSRTAEADRRPAPGAPTLSGTASDIGTQPATDTSRPAGQPTSRSGPSSSGAVLPTRPSAADQRKVFAYYFHRTLRCPACLSIEEQSRQAVQTFYSDKLASGLLEWRSLNLDAPENAHFEKDFQLERQSLVLAEMVGDEPIRRRVLSRVWELLEDPQAFQDYVISEVAVFLAGG